MISGSKTWQCQAAQRFLGMHAAGDEGESPSLSFI